MGVVSCLGGMEGWAWGTRGEVEGGADDVGVRGIGG